MFKYSAKPWLCQPVAGGRNSLSLIHQTAQPGYFLRPFFGIGGFKDERDTIETGIPHYKPESFGPDVPLPQAGVTVVLTDAGREFVPADAPDLSPGEVRVRGYGLHLLRRLVDEVEYRRIGHRNRWRLRRRYPTVS